MEWLKKLLEKHGVGTDLIEAIMGDTKDTNYIPKERFDEVNNSLKELKGQLAERDKQLKDLGDKAKDNEALSKQISDLQEANKKVAGDYESKIKNMTIDNAIKQKLIEGNAKHSDLLMGKFDRDKLKITEDGKIEGLEDQYKNIQESYKDLFADAVLGSNGGNPAGGGNMSNKLEDQYAQAMKDGNMPLAISIKNKIYETLNKI